MSNPLSENEQKIGMRRAFAGQSVGILLSMLLTRSAFGTLYLKHLGASDAAAMWVLAVPGIMPLVQIPLSLLVHPKNAKRYLILGWLLFAAFMGVAALAPSMAGSPEVAYQMTVALIVLAVVANMAGATFWFPLLHDVIPSSARGRFFGKLRATWATLLYLAIVASGLYLGDSPGTDRFQTVILVGVALALVRCALIAKVPTVSRDERGAFHEKNPVPFLARVFEPPPLRRFLIYYALFSCSAGFLGHPLVLYMRDIGFNPRNNLIVFGCAMLGMVAALFFGGRVLDRLGSHGVFKTVHGAITLLLFGVFGITWLTPAAVLPLLAVAFIACGTFLALSNLACTTHLFKFVPDKGRIFYLTFANLMLIIGPATASLVTGFVLDNVGEKKHLVFLGTAFNVYQILLVAAFSCALVTTPLLLRIVRAR